MEWKKVRLGDYISIKSGLAYSGSKIGKGDSILLGMGCVSFKEKFVETGARPYDDYCDERFVVKPGEIVLATRQQSDNLPILAMPAIIPKSFEGKRIIFGTNLYKVENKSELSNRFLFWLLKNQHYFKYIAGVKSGTAVQMVTKKNVEDYKFLCPSQQEREKIADILWSYDNLIENNTRRIRLLEQMAENLYKEWFVRFRFPGHEKVEFENGLPKGWKKVTLDTILEKLTTGLNPRKNFVLGQGENYYVTIKNMGDNTVYLDDNCDKVDDEAIQKINKRSDLKIGDILFSGIGTIGRVFLITIPTNNWNVSESVFTMRANEIVTKEFLYMMLLSDDLQNYCQQHAQGVAQPGIRMSELKAYRFFLPPKNIITKFSNTVSSILSSIDNLRKSNSLLTRQRDLLLPRLMSGKLEVKE